MDPIEVTFGASGIKDAYKLVLASKSLDVICTSKDFRDVIGDFYDNQLYPEIVKKQLREVIPSTPDNKEYQAKTQTANHKIGLMAPKYPSETDLLITDSEIILVSFQKDQPVAMISRNSEMIKQMRTLFEKVWETCEK